MYETKRFIIEGTTGPWFTTLATDIPTLSNYWNKMVDTGFAFRGWTPAFNKQAVILDVNIRAGYMHSGIPINGPSDLSQHFLSTQITSGAWGIFHELGHNLQDYKWTVSGTIEVTCNIYSLLLFEKLHNQPVMKSSWLMGNPTATLAKFNSHMALPVEQRLTNYYKDYGLALYLYGVLLDQVGFDTFARMQANYNQLNVNLPDDTAKYNQLVLQFSKVIGQNAWAYFYNWGMPVTQDINTQLSNLPQFKCTRHPNLTP